MAFPFFPQLLRCGYPFFLSLSDVDATLEILNPTPSVHQTLYSYCYLLWGCATIKKNTTYQHSPINTKSKTSQHTHTHTLHISPNPPNPKNIENARNTCKITIKSLQTNENQQQTYRTHLKCTKIKGDRT